MSRKINLILSLISLFVTSFVLIFVMFAWYVTNSKATVNGINGRIMDKIDIVDDYEIYAFSAVTKNNNGTSTYTLEELDEFRYDPDFDKTPSAILIKINFIDPAVNLTKFEIEDSSSYFPGYSATKTSGWIDSNSNLSLSSVIKFSLLSNVSFSGGTPNPNGGTVTFNDPTYSRFQFNETSGLITSRSQSLINGEQSNITNMYIIVDFDEEAFEKLCSNNIGNSVFEDVSELSYNTDFKFQIAGSVVNS